MFTNYIQSVSFDTPVERHSNIQSVCFNIPVQCYRMMTESVFTTKNIDNIPTLESKFKPTIGNIRETTSFLRPKESKWTGWNPTMVPKRECKSNSTDSDRHIPGFKQ